MPNQVIGSEIIADYILYWLNKHGHFGYAEKLGLDGPVDQIDEFLAKFCIKKEFFIKKYDPGGRSTRRTSLDILCSIFLETNRFAS